VQIYVNMFLSKN